jgi:hypothetical protein
MLLGNNGDGKSWRKILGSGRSALMRANLTILGGPKHSRDHTFMNGSLDE